jgi:hypothetical protein
MEVYKQKMNNAIAKRASFSKRQLIKNKRDGKGTIFGQSGVVQKNKNTEIVLRRNKQKEMTEQKYDVYYMFSDSLLCVQYTTRV